MLCAFTYNISVFTRSATEIEAKDSLKAAKKVGEDEEKIARMPL